MRTKTGQESATKEEVEHEGKVIWTWIRRRKKLKEEEGQEEEEEEEIVSSGVMCQ